MNDHDRTEDLLRRTLSSEAEDVYGTLTIDDIRRGAAGRQRPPWRVGVLVAAAAAVAIGVPTALVVRSDTHTPSTGPTTPTTAPSTATQSPSPSATSTPGTMANDLHGLPQTAAPGVTYLWSSTIHLARGGTTKIPGDGPFGDFAAYHGGWLVCDPQASRVVWYDNTGRLQRQYAGTSHLASSPDGMRLAFDADGSILIGITTGMGEGEDKVPVNDPQQAWPVGFLSDGTLVYMDGGHVRTDNPIVQPLPASMVEARAVSVDDVIAGTDDQGRGMAWSAKSGAAGGSHRVGLLWAGLPWSVTAFSDDGRYAAAASTTDSAVAILDARTGEVVAQDTFSSGHVRPSSDPVFDTDGSLLVSATDGSTLEEAVVRLEHDGTVSRATEVFPLDPRSDSQQIRFAVGR